MTSCYLPRTGRLDVYPLGCPRPSIALQVQYRSLKHHSFHLDVYHKQYTVWEAKGLNYLLFSFRVRSFALHFNDSNHKTFSKNERSLYCTILGCWRVPLWLGFFRFIFLTTSQNSGRTYWILTVSYNQMTTIHDTYKKTHLKNNPLFLFITLRLQRQMLSILGLLHNFLICYWHNTRWMVLFLVFCCV